MKYGMWSAAALMGLTTCVHLFAGTGDIMTPIMNADIHPIVKSTAMVVWHGVTLILALLTLAIAHLARRQNPALFGFAIAIQLGFAALFLFYNLSMFGGVFTLPQWTVFLLAPALMIFARTKAA